MTQYNETCQHQLNLPNQEPDQEWDTTTTVKEKGKTSEEGNPWGNLAMALGVRTPAFFKAHREHTVQTNEEF